MFRSNRADMISFLGLFLISSKRLFILFGNKLGDLACPFRKTGPFWCQKLETSFFHAAVIPII